MSKKSFAPIGTPPAGLSKLAAKQPTQSVKVVADEKPASKKDEPDEPVVRLTMEVRESLRDDLRRAALEGKTTIQAFVMEALKAKGIKIIDSDLIDKRTRRRTRS